MLLSIKGRKVSDATKQKLSEMNTGLGDRLTDKGRQAIIAAGKKRTGTKNSMYNRKHKTESIQRMVANRSGEKHPRVVGHYITPWGKFLTAGEAAEVFDGHMNLTSLRRWCRKNNNKVIRRQSYLESSYLHSLGEGVVGKTFNEIGFDYEEF